MAALQAQMAQMGKLHDINMLDQVRGVNGQSGLRQALNETGAFRVEAVKTTSATETFTEALRKQDVTLNRLRKSRGMMNEVIKEQFRLQNMSSMGWTQDARNRVSADAIIPREAPERLNSFRKTMLEARDGTISMNQALTEQRMRLGVWSEAVKGGANEMINWGKNTQWAGRQLMVGFTVPFVAFGALAAKAFYDVDENLTKITRVYDYTAQQLETNATRQAAADDIRSQAMRTATQTAKMYGSAIEDTLDVTSQLAASGQRGNDLWQNTLEIQRASMLGNLDYNKTVETAIALQNVFGMSNEEVAESFDYMNSMENSTVLTMQDFVETIPRVAGVLEPLGGSLQEIGTMMTAMKAAGIPAAQGANALKSALGSMLLPTARAKKLLSQFTDGQVNLAEIVANNKGDLLPTFIELNEALVKNNVSAQETSELMFAMFGKHQAARINGLVTQLRLVNKEGTQMNRAMKVGEGDAADWASTAATELAAKQESASHRFKAALETMRAELATAGEPFLDFAADALGLVTKLIGAFNGMGDTKKQWILWAAAIMAVVGPLIMVAGLFANFIGQIIRGGASLLHAASGMKILNMEERLAALAAKQAGSAFATQAQQAHLLTAAIKQSNSELAAMVALQRQSMGLPAVAKKVAQAGQPFGPGSQGSGGLYQTNEGRLRYKDQATGADRFATRQQGIDARDAAHSEAIAENAKRTADNTRRVTQNISGWGMGVSFLGSMVTQSGSMANNFFLIMTYVSMMGMMAPGMFAKMGSGIVSMGGKMKDAAARSTVLRNTMARVGPLAARAAAAAGPIGLALAAAGVSAWYMHQGVQATRKEVEAANKGAEAFANILGFAYVTAEKMATGDPNKNVNIVGHDQLKQLKKQNGELFEELDKFSGTVAEKRARAIEEGIKVRLHGGTKKDAEEATAIAYQTMTQVFNSAEQKGDFLMQVRAEMNFENVEGVARAQMSKAAQVFRDTANDEFDESHRETVSRWILGDQDANQRAGAEIRDAAKEMYTVFASSIDDEAKRMNFDAMQDTFKAGLVDALDKVGGDARAAIRTLDVGTPEELYAEWEKGGDAVIKTLNIPKDQQDMILRALDAMKTGMQAVGKQAGMSDEDIDKINFEELRRRLGVPDAAAAALSGLGAEATNVANEVESAADSIDHLLNAASPEELTSAIKDTWTNAWGGVMDEANEQIEGRHEAAMEQIQASGQRKLDAIEADGDRKMDDLDRRSKALDRQNELAGRAFESRWTNEMRNHEDKWKKRMSIEETAFETREKAIDKAIDAEQKAEEVRQRIFEAEQARIQRRAQMFNQNVDFNMALNSGDMDEAAKVLNNARAAQEQWSLEDANVNAEGSSSERVAGLEAEKEKLSERKDARMAALEEQEEREKRALDDRKVREQQALEDEKQRLKDALDAEKKRLDDGIAARKAAAERENQINESTAQKSYDVRKKALDKELAVLREFIPQNEAEQQQYIRDLEAAYGRHGITLNTTSKEWGDKVTGAMNRAAASAQAALANDIKWKAVGEDAASKITQGAFGMNKAQFMQWVSTGTVPKSLQGTTSTGPGGQQFWTPPGGGKPLPLHTGGYVKPQGGGDGGSRVGYSEMNSRLPSERDTRLKVGEYVVNKNTVNKLGKGFMDDLNSGKVPAMGGGDSLGMAGLMAGSVGAVMKSVLRAQIMNAGMNQARRDAAMAGMDFGTSAPGKYGGTNFIAEQLANAATIMSVGRSMGASDRDLLIGLMTAMQESMLRNINGGDRDSLGLFQQRPSQGWGSPEQIMDPKYSSRKFFEGLLGLPDRGSMSLTGAAQAVQRSAFPNAYAKWEDEARAIMAAQTAGAQATWDGTQLPGGFAPPTRGYAVTSEYGMRTNPVTGQYKLHNGIDLAARTGTPIFAVQNGAVLKAGAAGGYGNWTVIGHPGGLQTGYAHQSRIGVREGQQVKKGQHIGDVGSTGNSTGPHLHFTAGMNGNWVNPRSIIPGLKVGGDIRSEGIARLHEKETVLTAPLSAELKNGIKNLDAGAGTTYNVTMDLRGAYIKEDIDIESALDKALEKKEGRLGRKRTIT